MRASLGLTIAFLLAFAAPAATQAAPRPCPKPKEATKRQPWSVETRVGARLVVYIYAEDAYGHTGLCNRVTGKRWQIDQLDDVSDRDLVAIAGWRVAYVYSTGDIDTDIKELHIADARTGDIGTIAVYDLEEQPGIDRLALRPSGALAWSRGNGIFACRVCSSTKYLGSKVRRLAGRSARPQSLRVTPRGVRWRQSGRWRYARLP